MFLGRSSIELNNAIMAFVLVRESEPVNHKTFTMQDITDDFIGIKLFITLLALLYFK